MNKIQKVFVPTIVIILLLAIIAIPSFLKARKQAQQNACMNNMRISWSGAVQHCFANRISPDKVLNVNEFSSSIGTRWLVCPAGKEPYAPFSVFQGPVCPNGHQFAPGVQRPIKAHVGDGPFSALYKEFGFTNLIEKAEPSLAPYP